MSLERPPGFAILIIKYKIIYETDFNEYFIRRDESTPRKAVWLC